MKRHGSGCRFLMARHKAFYASHSVLPIKDEITALVCNQGRKITWDDEDRCLAAVKTCWQLERRKQAQAEAPSDEPSTEPGEAPAPEAAESATAPEASAAG